MGVRAGEWRGDAPWRRPDVRTIGETRLHYCDRHRLPKAVEKELNLARAAAGRSSTAEGL